MSRLDAPEAGAELERNVEDGRLTSDLAEPLYNLIRDGHCIVSNPVPGKVLEEAASARDWI